MHRIVWYKIGEQRIHLLKLAGAFFILASGFKVGDAAYQIFLTASKIQAATIRPDLLLELFDWALGAPGVLIRDDVIGLLVGPFANFFFWMGATVLAIMLYQSGKAIFPIEEWDAAATVEHKKKLISHFAKHRHKFAAKKKR